MDNLEKEIKNVEMQIEQMQAHAELENKFAEEANERFEKNLLAFQQYFPDIYDQFINFSPSEKFQLMVNPDGSANIVDYGTGIPIYDESSVEQTLKQVSDNFESPVTSRVNYSSIEFIENKSDFLHVDLMNEIGKSYNAARNSLSPNRSVESKIPSLMVFGVGLGYHLPEIQKRTQASYITIFEPNKDYFYASLFSIDWDEYLRTVDDSGAFLYIGIGDSNKEIYETVYRRAQLIGPQSLTNSLFYQHYPSVEMAEMIDIIKTNFHQFFMGWGFFDDALMSVAHTIDTVAKKPKIAIMPGNLPKAIHHYPVFIVANGPSLDDDMEKIKALSEKAIIVACNSASTALVSNGIIPDFHVALERTSSTYDFLKEYVPEEARAKMNLLVLNVMHPDVLELFPWTGIALKGSESGTSLIQRAQLISGKKMSPNLAYSNPLVGNTALSFFISLGFKEVYLFGVDSGYIDTSHHHSKSSFYYQNNTGKEVVPFRIGEDFPVPGNFVDTVYTEPFLYTGKEQMERLLSAYKESELNCYNCSNGVKVEGAMPLPSDHILINESEISKQELVDFIKSSSFEDIELKVELEDMLDFDVFQSICDTMIEILKQPFNNRGEALDVVMEQIRYFKSFHSDARFQHLYLILEGEALYINSVLLSLLYDFGSYKDVLPHYHQGLDLWVSFLEKAPDYYRERCRMHV